MASMKTLEVVLRYAVTFLLVFYLLQQVRKPSRWTGRLFVWLMNMSHSKLTDWGLQHVQIGEDFTILDVGCGGGRTIQKLALMATSGMVYGIDYADGSVAASQAKNVELIKANRVEIHKASVSQLPFPENKFDLVTAIETQYYWPDPVKDMQEILRTLKPGGTLAIIAESYKRDSNKLEQAAMRMLRSSNLGTDEQQKLFQSAGYADVQIYEEPGKGWICVTGKKPK
ncbi:MAG TPA: class I SAM-dependent methyltransferase [Terriglobales bacterium]|nr:class I SAM-dependent methyltransferase [Terriglobales bacterium]